jgi:hypothetical protein
VVRVEEWGYGSTYSVWALLLTAVLVAAFQFHRNLAPFSHRQDSSREE